MQNERLNKTVDIAANQIKSFSMSNPALSYSGYGLPEYDKIVQLTALLRSAMFPGFFGTSSPIENPYAVGSTISAACLELLKQVKAALLIQYTEEEADNRAEEITIEFTANLPKVQQKLAKDVEALFNGDPAALSYIDVIFSYPGLIAISVYRLAHELYKLSVPLIPRMMTEYAHAKTGIDINAGAVIGDYFFIDHGTGIVIGETTVIGDQVKLYQGVTLGALSTRKGQMLKGMKRHPTIGDRVTVYSGASILGGETVIGDDCIIGSNAFVTGSVPPRTRVMNASCELSFRKMDTQVWENS